MNCNVEDILCSIIMLSLKETVVGLLLCDFADVCDGLVYVAMVVDHVEKPFEPQQEARS